MKNIYCRSEHYGSHAKAMLGGIQTKLTPPVSDPVCSENTPSKPPGEARDACPLSTVSGGNKNK